MRQRDHAFPSLQRQDRAGRVVYGRDRIDELWRDALSLQAFQGRFQRVHIHAVLIDRHEFHLYAETVQFRIGAAVITLLQNRHIARPGQRSVHQVHRLKRTGGDQDFIRVDVHARVFLLLRGDVFAERAIPLRPGLKVIGAERRSFPLQHRIRRGPDRIDGDGGFVIVPADEIVFRKTAPPWRFNLGGGVVGIIKAHGGSLPMFFGTLCPPDTGGKSRHWPFSATHFKKRR